MNILVTGGAGYVGSHAAKALANAGHRTVTYDNLSRGHKWAVRWGPLVVGDVADYQLLLKTLREFSIDAVIHFAGSAYVAESLTAPWDYFQNNCVNGLTVLDAMRASGVQSIIFSSSCATYGVPCQPTISEQHPQRPINPYGESKLFMERALHWYGEASGIRWLALRYFNAAGADPDGEIGEAHHPETHLIPLAIRAALGQGPPLQVMGTDHPTPDGTAIRDYIHVADLAEAHSLGLEYLSRGGESMAINIGTGQGYSVREVIGAVSQVAGRSVPFTEGECRPGDPPILVAETGLACSMLHWTPHHRDLAGLIRSAWDWHSSQALCSPTTPA
jgi:UDP-arabinose 4-epimerase